MKTISALILVAYFCAGCQTMQRLDHVARINGDAVTGTHIRNTIPTPLPPDGIGPPADYSNGKTYTWRGKPREWRWIGDGWPTQTFESKKETRTALMVIGTLAVIMAIQFATATQKKPQLQGGGGCPQWLGDSSFAGACFACGCFNQP